MSAPYGFRVFVLTAHPNRVKGNDPLPAHKDSGLPQEMFGLLEQLSDRKTFFIEPKPRDDDDDRPLRPTVSVTVDPPVMVSPQMIAVRVSTGLVGAHREATHPTAETVALTDYSAEAEYLVSFHYPKFGERFFMVAQTFNRHDVAERVISLIKQQSYSNRKAAEAADKDQRDAARAAGQKPAKKVVYRKLVFDKQQAADDSYLDEILGAAKKISATFTAVAPNDRGGDGNRIERTLTINLGTDAGRDAGRRISRVWKERARGGHSFTRRDAVGELGSELHSQGLLREDEASEYDHSKLTVTAESAPAATIAIDTMKDVFTYPVSEGKPDPYYFYKRVSARLDIIASQEDIEIQTIDPDEASSCLDVST